MQANPQNSKPKILVIEDDKDQAFVLRYFLKNSGYRVDWCGSPGSCLRTARNELYDLVLLDVMLNAEQDGFDICKQFKSDPQLRNIPIIMVTARTAVQDRIDGLNLGADDYVTKPFNREELASRIKAVLKRKIYTDLAARYRELIENNTDPVLFLNIQGQIEHANRRAEAILPHLVATNHELDFSELFDPVHRDDISSALYKALSGEEVEAHRWKLQETGNTNVIVNAQLVPLRHGDRIIGIGCTLRDTSEQEHVFQRLEEDTRQLKEKVKTKSAELNDLQQRLVMSEKLAVMGQLAAGIAHEFRNPLNTINASVYYLQTVLKNPPEKVGKHLLLIEEELKRSRSIIDNLLEFSKKSPARTETDIGAIIHSALQLVKKELSFRNIQVVMETEPVKTCYVNPDDMKQVLLNLILNARDAMPEGGTLTLKTCMTDPETVRIDCIDTGMGFPEELSNKIFEPFYTQKEAGKGVGIGLSIVHSAIQRNNGTIHVHSVPDKGTRFTIYLPVYSEKASTYVLQEDPHSQASNSAPPLTHGNRSDKKNGKSKNSLE
jgi:PAS domain S-box-containing protein